MIFSITPTGIGNKDMKYSGRLEREAFKRISRPPKDSRLPFHVDSFFAIRSIIGSQVACLEVFAPTGRPKYVNGIAPILQWRVSAIKCSHRSLVFNPIIELLWKFTCRPDESSNRISAFLMFINWAQSGAQN